MPYSCLGLPGSKQESSSTWLTAAAPLPPNRLPMHKPACFVVRSMWRIQSALSRWNSSLISVGETCSIASLIDFHSSLTAIVQRFKWRNTLSQEQGHEAISCKAVGSVCGYELWETWGMVTCYSEGGGYMTWCNTCLFGNIITILQSKDKHNIICSNKCAMVPCFHQLQRVATISLDFCSWERGAKLAPGGSFFNLIHWSKYKHRVRPETSLCKWSGCNTCITSCAKGTPWQVSQQADRSEKHSGYQNFCRPFL